MYEVRCWMYDVSAEALAKVDGLRKGIAFKIYGLRFTDYDFPKAERGSHVRYTLVVVP